MVEGKFAMGIGPLSGVKVVELAGIGPAPFAAMVLADLGADVIRIDRPHAPPVVRREFDVTSRSRRSLAVDIRTPAGRDLVLRLVAQSDVLLEGMRPGVAERLHLGPVECHAVRESLVYGRMTGWGQDGPYAHTAGHDITYLAVTGGLHAIGHADRPPAVPVNVVGDFGGGAMYLALGVVAGVLRARSTGRGDVVDASIVDGVGSLYAMVRGFMAQGTWKDDRESNFLDGGAPYYRAYRCADGKDIAVGAMEPQFWAELQRRIGLEGHPILARRDDPVAWDEITQFLAEHFATRPRDAWVDLTAGTDACLAPVLSLEESLNDPHLRERSAFVDVDGMPHPAPSPRFAVAGTREPERPPRVGEHTDAILSELGLTAREIAELRSSDTVA